MRKNITFKAWLAALMLLASSGIRAQSLDDNGVYQIGSAADLVGFATLVNGDEPNAQAVLTADIDMTDVEGWIPIGKSVAYTGFFDGQNHKITGFHYTGEGNNNGLFGLLQGATVQNFQIEGTLTCAGAGSGLVGWAENYSTLRNLHSALVIDAMEASAAHVGGIIGSLRTGTQVIGCSFSGIINAGDSNGDCYSCIAGYTNEYCLVEDCANYGSLIFSNITCYAGGIVGYVNNTAFNGVKNCINVGEIRFAEPDTNPTYSGAIFGRLRDHNPSVITNNYWLDGSALWATGQTELNAPNNTKVTAEQFASGEITYALNGNNPEGAWTQTLGTDQFPMLFPVKDRVYAAPAEGFRCDGTPLGETSYTNNKGNTEIPPHSYNGGGVCAVCGNVNPEYKLPNGEGFYELANANDLIWFGHMVSAYKDGSMNAILTSDIDISEEEAELVIPIGDTSVPFTGSFFGQNHKITGFNMKAKGACAGLFGKIQNNEVKDFSIEGYLSCVGACNGCIAMSDNSVITNIHSALEIYVPASGVNVTHTAGIIGDCQNGSVVSNCSFTGMLTVDSGHDCFGGICGYTNTGKFVNCANYGQVLFAVSNCYASGIVGYVNNSSFPGCHSCLNVGDVRYTGEGEPQYGGAIVGRMRSYSTSLMGENWWLETSAVSGSGELQDSKFHSVTADQLASGEVAWLLNGETFVEPAWFQTIGEDEWPVFDSTHGVVYGFSGDYGYVMSGDVDGLRAALIAAETAYVEDLVAQKAMKENYLELVQSFDVLTTLEEIADGYSVLMEEKADLQANADAYQAFIDKVEATKAELEAHPEIVCPERELLEDYLESDEGPSEEHPYGGALYIVENELLSTEEIKAETARIDAMMDAAVSNSLTPGSDITRFVTNPDFAAIVEGWEGSTPSHIARIEAGNALEARDGRLFDLHQTVTGLPDGYYIVSANAVFRPGSMTDTNTNYGAYIYANDNVNYVMAAGEDLVNGDEAVSLENCYLEEDGSKDVMLFDESGDEAGYTPNRATGMVYAIKGGRYADNLIVARITDGTLTFGINNQGTAGGNDWMGLGNFKLTFAGPDGTEDALPYITTALQSQVARAKKVLDFYGDVGDYKYYPNFSNELRAALSEAVTKAESAATVDEAYAMVLKLSELFQTIYDGKNAYVSLMNMAEAYYTVVYDENSGCTQEELNQADAVFNSIVDKWVAGEYSTEEAWAQAELVDDPLYQRFYGQSPELVNGVYQISTAEQLCWFTNMVKAGNDNMKAVLIADIDMTEVAERFYPIGNAEIPFTGTFDGQNHKITGFSYVGTGDYNGLFGQANGATIENFSIEGTLKAAGTGTGAIGWIYAGTVRNVHSSLVIDATEGTVHHVGGVVGSLRVSSTIENSTFSGTITVGSSNDCFGGIAGYSHEYASIRNCAHYGGLYFASTNCYAGGLLGYLNNGSFYGVHNSISVGDVKYTGEGEPSYSGAIVGRLRDHSENNFGENYWLETSAKQAYGEQTMSKGKSVTAEKLASGEICYLLNEAQGKTVWYQTLGVDPYPVLDDTHKEVFKTEDGNYTNGDQAPALVNGVYQLATPADLVWFADNAATEGLKGELTNAIDLSNTEWKPIGTKAAPFTGEFNGHLYPINGISNMLFGTTSGATITGVALESGNIEIPSKSDYAEHAGTIIGEAGTSAPTTLSFSYSKVNITTTGSGDTGGLSGKFYGKIFSCAYIGSISGENTIGGLIGSSSEVATPANISCSYSYVESFGGSGWYKDALVGWLHDGSSMNNCYAIENVGGYAEHYNNATVNNVKTISKDVFASGEVAWNLNLPIMEFPTGESSAIFFDSKFVWLQTIGEDAYPVLCNIENNPQHGLVYEDHDGTFTNNPVSIANVLADEQQVIYDLQGRKLDKISQKGIYIVNGKRVLVK